MYKVHGKPNISQKAQIGDGTRIGHNVFIGGNVVIGDNCNIQGNVFIPDGVIIGNNVFIGPCVCFTNVKHRKNFGKHIFAETWVGDNVIIGANATILSAIVIRKGAMIGAGAVVTKDVPCGKTVKGNPAK